MPIIDTEDDNRHILIWIHPSAFEEVLTTLEFAREQLMLQDGEKHLNNRNHFKMFHSNSKLFLLFNSYINS
jgi:hypothetical protein